jgi:transposase
MNAHRRHDLSDQIWTLLEPHLPGRQREIIDCLSKRFCRFCARARLSEICRQIMAAGATRTVVLSAGETKGFRKVYSQKWCNNLILNGFLADRAYDTREIIEYAENNG